MIALACAHPAKFPDAVERATGIRPALPPRLDDLLERRERLTVLPNDLGAVTRYIRARARRARQHLTGAPHDHRSCPPWPTDCRSPPTALTPSTRSRSASGSMSARGTSRREINGVAHFLEHMAFKGTERRSALAIAEEIEAVGGHLNAYTSRESTAYYAKVLKEDVPLALDIIADILQHSTFEPEEMERERAVMLQEIGQANDTPDDIIFDYFQECAYPDQAMGRPVLGGAEIIRQLGREAVARLSSRPLRRAAHGARGGRQSRSRRGSSTLAEELLRRPAGGTAGDDASRRAMPVATGARSAISNSCISSWAFPGWCSTIRIITPPRCCRRRSAAACPPACSRRSERSAGLVYSIHSFVHGYRDGGLFGIYAGTGEDEVAELVPVLCEEAIRLEDGLTPVELARAKTQMKAGLLMSLESTSARCEQLAQHLLIHGTPFDPPRSSGASRRLTMPQSAASWRAGARRRRRLQRLGR